MLWKLRMTTNTSRTSYSTKRYAPHAKFMELTFSSNAFEYNNIENNVVNWVFGTKINILNQYYVLTQV